MPTPDPGATRRRSSSPIGRNVIALGIVSFFNDVSSDMLLPFLPLFLADVLGTQTTLIGLIEGVAESAATLLKLFSGWFSDRLRRRKGLALVGYSLSNVAKPLLYWANHWGAVLGIRFTDRVGKGVRTAPRDALVAASADEGQRGRAFGFHRALDTAGAALGTGLIALVVYLSQRGAATLGRATFQRLVGISFIPGVLAVLVLFFFVREIRPRQQEEELPRLTLRGFDRRFLLFLGAVVLFTLGNSSDAFIILRAKNTAAGPLNTFQIALMLVTFNLVYAAAATPAGILSDRIGRRRVILLGWAVYGLIYLGFALAQAGWQIWLLFALYGLYYAAFEGTSRALVADIVPDAARHGTAYGLYHTAVGVAALPASLLAGLLWDTLGVAIPFYAGAGLALAAAALLWIGVRPRKGA